VLILSVKGDACEVAQATLQDIVPGELQFSENLSVKKNTLMRFNFVNPEMDLTENCMQQLEII
jgi:hypothetical protein